MRIDAANTGARYADHKTRMPASTDTPADPFPVAATPALSTGRQTAAQEVSPSRSISSAQASAALLRLNTVDGKAPEEAETAAGWDWKSTGVDGVQAATGPDGRAWTRIDIGKTLTEHDKSVLGWPSDDENRAMLAAIVASNRADGTLTGPLDHDHVLGNRQKGVAGLVDQLPSGFIEKARGALQYLLDRL